jgi:hypothetical protein
VFNDDRRSSLERLQDYSSRLTPQAIAIKAKQEEDAIYAAARAAYDRKQEKKDDERFLGFALEACERAQKDYLRLKDATVDAFLAFIKKWEL